MPIEVSQLVKPKVQRISRTQESETLYKLEETRSDNGRRIAKEWLKVMNHPENEYWTRAIPQMLFDYLESYENACAELAAIAFLEHRGYKVIIGKPKTS